MLMLYMYYYTPNFLMRLTPISFSSTADDPVFCFKPASTTALRACLLSGNTTCDCPTQPYPCPPDSVFIETRHSECCVTFECRCPQSSCPLLMEGGLGVQPVPQYRGNRFPGRCCPEYTFEGGNLNISDSQYQRVVSYSYNKG